MNMTTDPTKSTLRLVVCAYFVPEITAALALEGRGTVEIVAFHGRCDERPIGGHCPHPEEIGAPLMCGSCAGDLPDAILPFELCFELLLGPTELSSLLSEGCHLLTPNMLQTWPENVAAWGFSPEMAREYFGESVSRFVVLDTGGQLVDPDALSEITDYTGRPVEVLPISLDYLRLMLRHVLGLVARQTERQGLQAKLTLSQGLNSDLGMAYDLLARMPPFPDEAAAVVGLLELFVALFAPGAVHYLPVAGTLSQRVYFESQIVKSTVLTLGAVRSLPLDAVLGDESAARDWGEAGDCGLLEGDGFHILVHKDQEILGRVLVEELAFPERRGDYLNLAAFVTPVLALFILNGRVYEHLRLQQIELEIQNEELHRAQVELDVARACYFDLYDLAPVGYCTISKLGRILQANIAATTLLGVSWGALVMQPITSFIFKEDQDIYYLHRKLLIKTGEAQMCELRLKKNDGTLIWVHLTATAEQDAYGAPLLRTVLSDITERKQTEEKLRMSDLALKAVSQGVFITSSDRCIISVNDAFVSITGYNNTEVLGRTCRFLQGPLTDPRMEEAIFRALENVTEFSGEILSYRKDGTTIWIELMISPVHDEHGHLTYFIGVIRDISVRKQAETELQESQNNYRALLREASDVIITAEMNGNLKEMNRAGELLLGYSQAEVCKMSLEHIYPAAELSKIKQHFKNFTKNGSGEPFATKIRCRNGRLVDVEVRPILDGIGGGKVMQGFFIDFTERKRLENARWAAENAHRDTLIREVHHRIKNNLQGITGILRQFAEHHPEIEEPLNQAISQVQSVAVIYGLQGRKSQAKVRVCELTVAIATGIETLWKKPVTVEIPDGWLPCTITEMEAVPLALILNELIWNAIKHSGAKESAKIILCHEPCPDSIRLTIHNNGLISVDFGLDLTVGFGTGLQLVALLLPQAGVRLSWAQHEHTVVTTLDLTAPVIHPDWTH